METIPKVQNSDQWMGDRQRGQMGRPVEGKSAVLFNMPVDSREAVKSPAADTVANFTPHPF